jgi:hypothetical protein
MCRYFFPLCIFLFSPRVSLLLPFFHFCPYIKITECVFRSFCSSNLENFRKTHLEVFFKPKKPKNAFQNIYLRAKKENCGYKTNMKGGREIFFPYSILEITFATLLVTRGPYVFPILSFRCLSSGRCKNE